MSSDNNSDNKEDDGETKEENKQEKLKVTVVDVDNVPDIVDNLIHNEEEQDVHLQNGEQVDDPEEPDDEDMEMAEPADELQMILDQLIQGNLGPILQENPVNEVLEDVAGAVFQNIDGDRLFFIMAQMNELFPEGNLEDPPDDLDDIPGPANHNPGDYIFGNRDMERLLARLFEEENDDQGPPPMEPEDIANIATIMVDQEMLDKCSSCPVCLDAHQLKDEVNILGCGHFFHAFCIKTWLGMHASCPVCRKRGG